MILNLYSIRNVLAQGKKIIDLPLRVTFYARVSTDHEEQLNSLENQVMYFENYIKSQTNWIFVPGYIDEGISGTSVNKRDNFLKMIDDAKKGMFNLILTKEISRFSRNTIDSIQYTQELLTYGVGVFFLNDNINTFDSDSELRLTIMSSIAQDEIRKLSERIRFGYKRSVEKGIVPGNDNFYGYKKNKGKLEIVEEEAELIRLIFNEYSKEHMGTSKLGYYLFDEYNIKYYINKADSWIDLAPDTTDYSNLSEEELIHHRDSCSQSWEELRDGKIYSCNYAAYATVAGIAGEQDLEETYNLELFTPEKKKELVEFRLGYTEKGYTNFCKKCHGFTKYNKAEMIPAEQI